jgi:hypothetical protein
VAENDPGILANAAQVLARCGEDMGTMIGLVDRALALNPSYVRGWSISGLLRVWDGQSDLAIEHVETSMRLSPRERMGQPLTVMGTAYFFKRQFDEAASKLLLSIQDSPGFPPSYRVLAACYAHMGRLDEARAIVARLRHYPPGRAKRSALLQPRGPRTLSVGPAVGCGRGDVTQTRRLAAILAADVAGYSRLIGAEEEGTLNRLRSIRAEFIDPKITEHRGRIVKTTGDGLLVEFASVVDALRCGVLLNTGGHANASRARPDLPAEPRRCPRHRRCRRRPPRRRLGGLRSEIRCDCRRCSGTSLIHPVLPFGRSSWASRPDI